MHQEAVRLGLPGVAEGVACEGCPPLEWLFQQFAEWGGELWLRPICVAARDRDDAEKVSNAMIVAGPRGGMDERRRRDRLQLLIFS